MALDVMHDINEGAVAYCLQDLFILVQKKKNLTLSEIQQRVRDFNYGYTYRYNKPSLMNPDKHNLNATQLYCLMVHMPFIFLHVKEKLEPYWEPIETLLKCMQAIYPSTITESDIKSLDRNITFTSIYIVLPIKKKYGQRQYSGRSFRSN